MAMPSSPSSMRSQAVQGIRSGRSWDSPLRIGIRTRPYRGKIRLSPHWKSRPDPSGSILRGPRIDSLCVLIWNEAVYGHRGVSLRGNALL